MVANLQWFAVQDALNQFREPWALLQRHGPVQFYITKDTRESNQLRAVFTRNCRTCLCQKPCMSLQNSRRSLADSDHFRTSFDQKLIQTVSHFFWETVWNFEVRIDLEWDCVRISMLYWNAKQNVDVKLASSHMME